MVEVAMLDATTTDHQHQPPVAAELAALEGQARALARDAAARAEATPVAAVAWRLNGAGEALRRCTRLLEEAHGAAEPPSAGGAEIRRLPPRQTDRLSQSSFTAGEPPSSWISAHVLGTGDRRRTLD